MLLSLTIYEQVLIYVGLLTCITGVLGGLLNVIVFLSFHTFRENSCAFYLTIISFLNIGQLLSGYLPRIMLSGFQIDWTQSSVIFCKFRWFHLQTCLLIISTCSCLATIDQFCATYVNPRWQQFANIKIARRLSLIFTCLWFVHGIPYLIYQTHMIIPSTNRTICIITDANFQDYFIYCNTLILTGFLPVVIMVIFGCLAYRNLRKLAFEIVPVVRRELDKQLTTMVLMHVILNVFTTVPYMIIVILSIQPDTNARAMSNHSPSLTAIVCLYYLNFSVSVLEQAIEVTYFSPSVHSIFTFVYLNDFVDN